MKNSNCVSALADPKSRSCIWSIIPAVSLLFLVFFIGSAFIAPETKNLSRWGIADCVHTFVQSSVPNDTLLEPESKTCETECRPPGSEALPRGIVSTTSNLDMRPLWGFPKKDANSSVNLLGVAVGIKQKTLVDKMVTKFLARGFVVMLFHYDGSVDEWKNFAWSDRVVHVAAINQTKWWFAKRFLHPDIVAEYDYIFLWDEDLGVQYFDPERYISIIKKEGLQISQPALDPSKSTDVHHQITVRGRKSIVHRRIYKPGGEGKGCNKNSAAPPCTGWIEVMAPVFSRASWRCTWYMIQNDLIHAWGLDMQLGYCVQGDRTRNIGVVDSEYVVHYGLPTLGGKEDKAPHKIDTRVEVRRQSYVELGIFQKRWSGAVLEDKCWVDPYKQSVK